MPRRLFIAIDLPKPVRWGLAGLVGRPPNGVRPVRPAQLHLTLHFLGDVDDGCRTALKESLRAVGCGPFTITIRGTGVFPPRGRPSVLWAGVAESSPLVELHAAVGLAIESVGLEVECRPYVPHVTLARLTPAVPRPWTAEFLRETADLVVEDVPVDGFRLFWSRRLDGGSEHVVDETYPAV